MEPSGDSSGISESAIYFYLWIVYGLLCQGINIFGIVTNVINIICFAKQASGDPVNITLLGLAISDLGSLATLSCVCAFLMPEFVVASLPFDPLDVMYLTSGVCHLSFTRVSACLTAMITLERCLCITAPLKVAAWPRGTVLDGPLCEHSFGWKIKMCSLGLLLDFISCKMWTVKSIITPKRATVITIGLFILLYLSGSPVYAVTSLGEIFSPQRNKTLVKMISTEHRVQVEMVSYAINSFCIPFVAFVIIVVCTVILSFKLRSQAKWRHKTVTGNQEDRVSTRNMKTAEMVVMISTLFIVCFVPVNVTMMAAGFIPELLAHGKYINISTVICGFGFIMEGLNSSMNIFIYYRMSSVYRDNFLKMCCYSV